MAGNAGVEWDGVEWRVEGGSGVDTDSGLTAKLTCDALPVPLFPVPSSLSPWTTPKGVVRSGVSPALSDELES